MAATNDPPPPLLHKGQPPRGCRMFSAAFRLPYWHGGASDLGPIAIPTPPPSPWSRQGRVQGHREQRTGHSTRVHQQHSVQRTAHTTHSTTIVHMHCQHRAQHTVHHRIQHTVHNRVQHTLHAPTAAHRARQSTTHSTQHQRAQSTAHSARRVVRRAQDDCGPYAAAAPLCSLWGCQCTPPPPRRMAPLERPTP